MEQYLKCAQEHYNYSPSLLDLCYVISVWSLIHIGRQFNFPYFLLCSFLGSDTDSGSVDAKTVFAGSS
jgi:hypothetical protein